MSRPRSQLWVIGGFDAEMTGNALAAFAYGIPDGHGEVFSCLSFRRVGAKAGIRRRMPRTVAR
jgi:hypothetical protein